MASSSNQPVDFDIIEGQKENIQALPSGRSARKLAELFSPSPLTKMATPTPSETRTVNDSIRAEYEAEIENISELDDPLDVYDRYVRWALDAYPSAQASPQSQLHTLLERATRAFVSSAQYKNDPRYLKLWLHYIHFFSDSPRETFVFLSRHAIGENLALFYEEYAAWLEGAGRWAQAEEVYKLGIEREARPTSRLVRKFGEFEARRAQLPEADVDGPSSPAIPTVRPVLGVKVDPFAVTATAPRDPQAPRPTNGVGGQAAPKAGRSKLQIFSDADAPAAAAAPSAMSSRGMGTKGWESIGSLSDRKKENVMEPKPWVGETLKAGGKKNTGPKLEIFRDAMQKTVNPATGKMERVFVDLRVVYPTPKEPGTELSFEEVWARNRGWLDRVWEEDEPPSGDQVSMILDEDMEPMVENMHMDENYASKMQHSQQQQQKMAVHRDVSTIRLDENGAPIYPKESKPRKKKMIEVNETQIIKAKLDSPSRPKMMKRRSTAEPTMTLHTKAATDDIYDIFNAPLKPAQPLDEGSDYESDDYTSGGESTTARNITTSEAGDVDEMDEDEEGDEDPEVESSDVKSISEWSDFSTRRHIPDLLAGDVGKQNVDDDNTQVSDLIDIHDDDDEQQPATTQNSSYDDSGLETPVEGDTDSPRTRTIFVPIPPEDYVPTRRPYRDPAEVANNRLPFMTPITERTESSLEFTAHELLAKTPCKNDDRRCIPEEDEEDEEEGTGIEESSDDLGPPSSPLREVSDDENGLLLKPKIPEALLPKTAVVTKQPLAPKPIKALALKRVLAPKATAALAPKGPIIKDAQCNPVDESVRSEILANIHPPLSSYDGFYDHRDEKYEKGAEIRKFIKAISKGTGKRSSTESNKTMNNLTMSLAPVIQFPDVEDGRTYAVKKELGKGAFAPVYLVENSHPSDSLAVSDQEMHDENYENSSHHQQHKAVMGRGAFALPHHIRHKNEALKMESPPTAWEFYMMRLSHSRLGPQHRATASLSPALEMHLYQDEGFLFLPYYSHGTLLDVVNYFRGDAGSSGVMDESLAMFFTVELFRTVEALHTKGICHGDLKVDNCLLRLGSGETQPQTSQLTGPYRADGEDGWASRGVMLIDFGRGIDMRAFKPDVQFIADWKTSAQDCAEMREGRPWTWQIDYHGLAGIVHCLLFGKYIEAVRCDDSLGGNRGLGRPGGRKYKIRENLKRYWQQEIWGDCFDLLLNPASAAVTAGEEMPVLKGMKSVREQMESWLETNGEKGVGLKSLMNKIEVWAGRGGRK